VCARETAQIDADKKCKTTSLAVSLFSLSSSSSRAIKQYETKTGFSYYYYYYCYVCVMHVRAVLYMQPVDCGRSKARRGNFIWKPQGKTIARTKTVYFITIFYTLLYCTSAYDTWRQYIILMSRKKKLA